MLPSSGKIIKPILLALVDRHCLNLKYNIYSRCQFYMVKKAENACETLRF
jgi:hypothetical protein